MPSRWRVLLQVLVARPVMTFNSSKITLRGSDSPVNGFEKLDKYAHCDGKVDPYMVYQRNLGLSPERVLSAGREAGLLQQEAVAIFGWTLGDFEFLNKIAWGAQNVTFGVEPFGFPHCTLKKADVLPYIEVLVSGLQRLPAAQPAVLWRGSKRSAKRLGKVIAGGFDSTSRSFDAAFNFVKGSGGSLWAIESHTAGKDISNFSDKPAEGEVLFPAGSRLEVVDCSPVVITDAIRRKVKEAETPSQKIDIICLKGAPSILVDSYFVLV